MKLVLLEKVYDYRSVPLHAANGSGGAGCSGERVGVGECTMIGMCPFPLTSAQVPITSCIYMYAT